MGTRAGGVGIGLWGGLGTAVLVFVFGERPGEPPGAAMLIILAVVTAAALMQAAGGIDWMVAMAARVIERHPRQITIVAPLVTFAFCIGAGTGNIIYPLLPVIYDVSYRNHIRPARPLTVTVVQSGMALAASPVSAAMAAMLTLTDVAPYNLGLTQILSITLPASVIGIVVTAIVVNRMWKDLDDDPEVQAKIASGELVAPPPLATKTAVEAGSPASTSRFGGYGSAGDGGVAGSESAASALTYTSRGRNSALAFLAGVLLIVILGLFPDLRPAFEVDGELIPIDMTTTITMVMFAAGVAILFLGRPERVRCAGAVGVQGRHGLGDRPVRHRLVDGNVHRRARGSDRDHGRELGHLGAVRVRHRRVHRRRADHQPVDRNEDDRADRARRRPGARRGHGLWAGALSGVYTLPANGTQIAAANFDLTGTTKLGTKLLDHSFFVPMLIMTVVQRRVGCRHRGDPLLRHDRAFSVADNRTPIRVATKWK